MKKIIISLSLTLLIAMGCSETGPRGELDYALAKPIFNEYYSCGEHKEGELKYIGDALGADCLINKLDTIENKTFARAYKTDGFKNEDWYSWKKPVFSPCDCEVIKTHKNETTNEPGILGKPPASLVILKRKDGVHFLLAHVDELKVEVSDLVKAGQQIAVVGNNGYGRNPHIHTSCLEKQYSTTSSF